jgi:phage terminase small subunit
MRKDTQMAAKKPATKGPDAQAAKPKPRAARKAAPKKPVKPPVTAAPEPAPVELSPLDQLLAQMDPRHVEFVEHYLVELNATKAYKKAFDPLMRENVAGSAASRLLGTVNVQKLLSARVKAMFDRTECLQDRLLEQLFSVAFVDANEISELRREACRYCHGDGHLYQFKPSEYDKYEREWQQAVRDAVAAKQDEPEFDPKGGIGYDPRKAPHEDCPECFGEGVEREVFKDTRHLSAAAKAMYGGVKRTKDGLEIIQHSQEKAREILLKILKMYDDKAELVLGVVPQEKLDAMYAAAMEEAQKGRQRTQGRTRTPSADPS